MPRGRGIVIPSPYLLAARVLLALPFLADGLRKLVRGERPIEVLSGAGVGFAAAVHYLSAAVETAGALALVLGLGVPVASVVLILYLVPTTLLLNVLPAHEHPSWALRALWDLGVAGGLVLLAAATRAPRTGERAQAATRAEPSA